MPKAHLTFGNWRQMDFVCLWLSGRPFMVVIHTGEDLVGGFDMRGTSGREDS